MRPQRRYHQTRRGTFWGDYVFDQVVKPRHFLIALRELFDWEEMAERFICVYEGEALRGRPPYHPALIFKMLFLSFLFDLSERMVEDVASDSLSMRYFLGLALDERVPDSTTLGVFKRRLVKKRKWHLFEEAFDEMIRQARAKGLVMGKIQVVDSVHTVADVNNEKDRRRQEKEGKPPRDRGAQIVNKGKRRVVGPDGKERIKQIRYKGYKTHVSVNAETGIVTTVVPTPGNRADNKVFPQLLAHDQALELPTTTYGGDRAYDDTDIHERIEGAGLHSGICLNNYRTKKKDANKQRWIDLLATPEHEAASKVRYRVEQPFGTAKQKHGFGRCRYLGLLRYGIQAFVTFMVVNCKRIIKLLTGITFRPLAKGCRRELFTPVYATLPWA